MVDSGIFIFTLVVATVLVVGAIFSVIAARNLWKRLLGKKEPEVQSVSVRFRLSGAEYGGRDERSTLQAFAAKLESILEDSGLGRYDGDEFGAGTGSLFFFGADADRIWDAIETEVRHRSPLPATEATILYGDYRSKRKTIRL